MERITVRKKISLQVIIYIILFFIFFPFIIYKIISFSKYSNDLDYNQILLESGKLEGTQKNLKRQFSIYGNKKKILYSYLSLLLKKEERKKSLNNKVEIIRICNYLINHSFFVKKKIYKEIGKSYFNLNENYYYLANQYLRKYLNKVNKIDLNVYEIIYQINLHNNDIKKAQEIALKISKHYPNNDKWSIRIAKCMIHNGEILEAKKILETIVYNKDYSKEIQEAGDVLVNLLYKKLGLKEKSKFVKSYLSIKNEQREKQITMGNNEDFSSLQ